MKDEMIYRIEYNPKQNAFHLEWEGKSNPCPENTYGWFTIASGVPDILCSIFCGVMEKFYNIGNHNLSAKEKKLLPSVAVVMHEYVVFFEYLNRLMELKMMGVITKQEFPSTN